MIFPAYLNDSFSEPCLVEELASVLIFEKQLSYSQGASCCDEKKIFVPTFVTKVTEYLCTGWFFLDKFLTF